MERSINLQCTMQRFTANKNKLLLALSEQNTRKSLIFLSRYFLGLAFVVDTNSLSSVKRSVKELKQVSDKNHQKMDRLFRTFQGIKLNNLPMIAPFPLSLINSQTKNITPSVHKIAESLFFMYHNVLNLEACLSTLKTKDPRQAGITIIASTTHCSKGWNKAVRYDKSSKTFHKGWNISLYMIQQITSNVTKFYHTRHYLK